MEQNLSTFISNPRKWQNIAGILLCSNLTIQLLFRLIIPSIQSIPLYYFVISWCAIILGLIALFFLYKLANNKPTKIALVIIMCVWILGLLPRILDFLGYISSGTKVSLSTINMAFNIYSIVDVLSIYSYSLIINNNSLENKDTSWIHILILCIIGNVSYVLSSFIADNVNFFEEFPTHMYWAYGMGTTWFNWIINILLIIAYWQFAHCATFNPTNTKESTVQYVYSPFNKYIVGALIIFAILAGVFYLLFANAGSIINFTESIF